MLLARHYRIMEHVGSLENTQEARVALGYCIGQLLRFFRALQTSHVLHNSIVHYKAWTNCKLVWVPIAQEQSPKVVVGLFPLSSSMVSDGCFTDTHNICTSSFEFGLLGFRGNSVIPCFRISGDFTPFRPSVITSFHRSIMPAFGVVQLFLAIASHQSYF